MMMRILRITVAVATVITVAAFGYVYARERYLSDATYPVITMATETVDVKASATDADLLRGVSAYDEKDGDLTDKLLVESVGQFTKPGWCKVIYAVCDGDNHVVTAQRQVHYTDYRPPRFTMNAPLIFSAYGTLNIVGIIGAEDCLDGDISQNVIIYSPDYETGQVGSFSIQATVKNSKGDSAEIVLPMTVERLSNNSPDIILKDYLIYLPKGKTPDWNRFIESTADHAGIDAALEIEIETDYNARKSGVYSVDYYGTDEAGYVGHTRLLVVTE
ncbi:MAG: hypothetical protein IJK89_11145 [Clostridia bacterium]|nr:hypothetical protein [Clostridia bacterium]